MRGHEPIIAARMRHLAPRIVFVNDYPCKTDWAEFAEHATVCTHNDPLSSLDLRFLVGLRVSISATDLGRAKGMFDRVVAAGASAVAAVHLLPGVARHMQDGWCKVHHAAPKTPQQPTNQ